MIDGLMGKIKNLQNLASVNPKDMMKEVMDLQKDANLLKDLNQLKMEDMNPKPQKIPVKFINKSNHPDPVFQHKDDSGFDLRANIPEDTLTLKPMGRLAVPTGLYFELPEHYELQVRPRSGLAYNHGITVLNTPGTVDRGYRGEIKIILINLGAEDFIIHDGDRIAQGVINGILSQFWSDFIRVNEVSDSERFDNGFGSTGKK